MNAERVVPEPSEFHRLLFAIAPIVGAPSDV
jgi:hypothetical protein